MVYTNHKLQIDFLVDRHGNKFNYMVSNYKTNSYDTWTL